MTVTTQRRVPPAAGNPPAQPRPRRTMSVGRLSRIVALLLLAVVVLFPVY